MKNLKISIPLIVLIASTVFLVLGLFQTWFGEARPGLMLFCEFAREGLVKQPANSYSNLIYTFVGIAIALHSNKITSSNNLMQQKSFYPILFSCVMILLGAGSFAMHATNAFWGGFADLFTMFLLSSFIFGYTLQRFFNSSFKNFVFIYVFNVSICSYFFLSSFNHFGWILSIAEIYFAAQLIGAILMELYAYLSKKEKTIRITYGITGVLLLCLAFFIWNLSRDPDDLLCDPHSLLQGHAAWHILNGMGAYFVYLFYNSEKKFNEVYSN